MSSKLLSGLQLEEFKQNGFTIIKGILNNLECEKFDQQVVQPALRQYSGIDQSDENTWNTDILKEMATGEYSDEKPDILPGVMVRQQDGSDPISDKDSLNMTALHPILDQLHYRNNSDSLDWEWLHKNVGWIHVRFPIGHDKTSEVNTWHVDGGHYTPHFLDSPEQSVIILPMIRPVGKGGGNTMILKKSHLYMAQKLQEAGKDGIPKEVTQNLNSIGKMWPKDLIVEAAPCDAGDVLLMHPFVVHSAGVAMNGHPLRIAFNMGVRWRRKPYINDNTDDLSHPDSDKHLSFLEKSISWSLKQSIDFVTNK